MLPDKKPALLYFALDIDECQAGYCHRNASCKNMPNSFSCTCDAGFSGNGTYCEGIFVFHSDTFLQTCLKFFYATCG